MKSYKDYSDRFLTALYVETEETGSAYHKASTLHQKFSLTPKDHWIPRIADDWEYSYFKDVSKVLGGYGSWGFRISADGSDFVEAQFRDLAEMKEFLGAHVSSDVDAETEQAIPASDRLVTLGHNQISEFQKSVDSLVSEMEKDNGVPDRPGLRERLLGQIRAGRELIIAGQFKAYLLYEVLITALNEIIEKYGNETIKSLANALLGALVAQLFEGQ